MAINLIVHQDRMRDGVRRVVAITEIVGMEGDVVTLQDIFSFKHDYIDDVGNIHGKLEASGLRPKCFEQILESGVSIQSDLFSMDGEAPYPPGNTKGRTADRALR
jgi:pilus assembly protein CpaF